MQRLHHADRGAEQRHDEAGVAAAGAETDRLAFEDGNVERGIGDLQMIGGGKARIAGADDGDVDGDVAGQWRARQRAAACCASQ